MTTLLRHKKIYVFAAASMLLAAISWAVFLHLGGILISQQAAERFAGDSGRRFAQVSLFLPAGSDFGEDEVYSLRDALDSALSAASVEAPQGGASYTDAYSAAGSLSVTGERGTFTAAVTGVGGDFFAFHPLKLKGGSYISGSDLMHDRVVLDEELAWKLFGGYDLAGMQVLINDTPYIVAGVVEREEDSASSLAYTAGAGLFMAYDALEKLSSVDISCYELVCADPVDDFVLNTVADFAKSKGFASAVTVQNSSRFGVEAELKIIASFGKRAMNTSGVIYPWWENAARYIEDWAALVLLLALLLSIPPLAAVTVTAILFIKRGCSGLRPRIEGAIDRRRARRYYRRSGSE